MEHKNEISQRSDKEELNRRNTDTSIDRVDTVKPSTSQINTTTVSTNIKVIAMKLCFEIIKNFLLISTLFYSTRKNYTSCYQEIVFNQ